MNIPAFNAGGGSCKEREATTLLLGGKAIEVESGNPLRPLLGVGEMRVRAESGQALRGMTTIRHGNR